MKKQVILDFLNLPGIVGLGLMDGYSRPYFSGIDSSLNFQQKEALTQGIQQVVSTTPKGFESFAFRFARRDARVYKLNNGVILVVVTDQALDSLAFERAIAQLKDTVQSDPQNTVTTFRLIAGSTTLNQGGESESSAAAPIPPPATATPSPDSSTAPTVTNPAPPAAIGLVAWQDCLAALNILTDATSPYLGKIVVANNWRAARPDRDALAAVQLDRNGRFSLDAETSQSDSKIDPGDYQHLQAWAQKFSQRCALIIRDYPERVLRQRLSDEQRQILGLESPDR